MNARGFVNTYCLWSMLFVCTVLMVGPLVALAGDDTCPADLTGDRRVNFQDLLVVLTHWGTMGPEGDVDGNGLVDARDLQQLLSAWGLCPQTTEGWTEFTPSEDTRIIYVSRSGSDGNDGLSTGSPVQTLSRGISLLRDGKPDWLLLKRGDVWTNEVLSDLPPGNRWVRSGRSADEPMVIASYGPSTVRPLVRTGAKFGFDKDTSDSVEFVAIVGIHLHAHTRTGSENIKGIRFKNAGGNFLVEDCFVEGFSTNIDSGGDSHNLVIRRSVIVDAFRLHQSGHSQGVYTGPVDGLRIEECVLDHNGWNEDVSGGEQTVFNHNVYTYSATVTAHRNIIASGAATGLMIRPDDGPCEKYMTENLFLRNPTGMYVHGQMDGRVEITGNVMLEASNILEDGNVLKPRGTAISVGGIVDGLINDNVVANNTLGGAPTFMALGWIGNTDIRDNLSYNWGGSVGWMTEHDIYGGITFEDNVIQNATHGGRYDYVFYHQYPGTVDPTLISSGGNIFDTNSDPAKWVLTQNNPGNVFYPLSWWLDEMNDSTSIAQELSFSDPERTIEAYHEEVVGGEASYEAFIERARLQSRGAGPLDPPVPGMYDERYTAIEVINYIREGFDLEAIEP